MVTVFRIVVAAIGLLWCIPGFAQEPDRPRLRDLGIEPGILQPGPLNAITDVAGVRHGCHVSLYDFTYLM